MNINIANEHNARIAAELAGARARAKIVGEATFRIRK